MSRPFVRLVAFGVWLGLQLGAACGQTQQLALAHQGVPRDYLVVNAPAGGQPPRPTMLVLHGRRDARAPNRSSPALDALAVREGFVAVYPAALQGAWHYRSQSGGEMAISMAGNLFADDFGFLTRLLDRLVAERTADPARIYVSGASLGGLMTYDLICGASEKIAAAAPLIATMTDLQMAACDPGRAVPVVFIAGRDDALMPYYGKEGDGFRFTSIPETTGFWVTKHHCAGQSARELSSFKAWMSTGGISTTRIDWTGCTPEGAVRLYRVDGGGHTLPSRTPIGEDERKRYGPRSTEFETSEEVWGFFKTFVNPIQK